LEKEIENCIGKYEDFLWLLAAGMKSPGIGDDASAGKQEHKEGGVRVVENVDACVGNFNKEEGSISINIIDANVDSNNGGNKVVDDNNDDQGVQSWDVDLVDDHVLDDMMIRRMEM
jgi:hypothetical protein